ncbi:prenyltransferase/squalene oxidase repeat-containing protein [Enterococcus sp. LJL99]
MTSEGYGKKLLDQQNADGQWGKYYYQPKWTSTHYTLLQLKDLGIESVNLICRNVLLKIFEDCQLEERGLNLAKSNLPSDICVDGMILNYASYFNFDQIKIINLVRSILKKQKKDGGFTWLIDEEGDPHSTICVLEGLNSFLKNFPTSNLPAEIEEAIQNGLCFFYKHHLFQDNKTYRKNTYPFRYHYSLIRFLLLAKELKVEKNQLVQDSIDWLVQKQVNGYFLLENNYKVQQFFEFSSIGAVDPFLTIYGRYILK